MAALHNLLAIQILPCIWCKGFELEKTHIEVVEMADEEILLIGSLFSPINVSVEERHMSANALSCLNHITKENLRKQEFYKIENLAEYVAPFGRQGCFVVLNNFRGIDPQAWITK